MLETLTSGFRNARLKLQGKARLDESNIHEALRDVRDSLLEGDVELNVARSFVDRVRDRALGEVVTLKASTGPDGTRVSPGDPFVKICHDELAALMGGEPVSLDLEGIAAARCPRRWNRALHHTGTADVLRGRTSWGRALHSTGGHTQ